MARGKKNVRIPFTPEQLDLIKKTPERNLKDVAFILNRNYDSVRRKKWQLENRTRDLERKKLYRKRVNDKAKEKAKLDNTRWTVGEEEFILTSNLTDIEIAKELGRTVSSVQVKRTRLLKERKEQKNAGEGKQ